MSETITKSWIHPIIHFRAEVPLLEDTCDEHWVFDAAPKKQVVNTLFTNMSGPVVCLEKSESGKNKASSSSAPKRKEAQAKAASGANTDTTLPQESGLHDVTVDCQRGVRQKVWLDDSVGCVGHTISSFEKLKAFKSVGKEEFDALKGDVIRFGLIFCFRQHILLPGSNGKPGKLYRKWSSLCPALQAFGVEQLVKDRIHQKCFCCRIEIKFQ